MEKALAIIYHYGEGKADFIIRANGKMEWNGPDEEPTESELEKWDIERLEDIEVHDQKEICIQNLKATDYCFLPDFEYQEDLSEIKTRRSEWKRILKSAQIEEIPPHPFS